MDAFLLSRFSIGIFSACLLSLVTGFFLAIRKETQTAGRWLSVSYFFFTLMFLGYTISYSFFHELAAFHRWMTVSVLFGTAAFVAFAYYFPENNFPLEAKRIIPLGWIIAFCGWLFFVVRTYELSPVFNFQSHQFNFQAGEYAAILIISFFGWIEWIFFRKLLAYAKSIKTKGNAVTRFWHVLFHDRRAKAVVSFMFGLLLLVATAIVNALHNSNQITSDQYAVLFFGFALAGFFVIFIVYINNSPEPTTFMIKLVGISLLTVLTLLAITSFFVIGIAEDSYDRERNAAVNNARPFIVSGQFDKLPEEISYVMKWSLDQPAQWQLAYQADEKFDNKGLVFQSPTEALNRNYRKAGSFYTHYGFENSKWRYEIGFSYLEYRKTIHHVAFQLLMIVLIGTFVIVLLYPLFFRESLLAPLNRLLHGVEQVNSGILDVEVPVKINDEIGFLSSSFNGMVRSIREGKDQLQDYAEQLELKVVERTGELNRTLEQLSEINKLKTNFFANVSHELRTPITLLLSPLESLLQKEVGSITGEQESILKTMHRNSLKLLKLVNNLLDFSKLEAGRMGVNYRKAEFVAYVRELSAAFDSAARLQGIEFKFSTNQDKIHAHIDPEKMDKIITNLLGNAFKFTSKGGVYIEVVRDEDDIELRIRDTGIGIPKDKLELVFERFAQVDGSASRQFEGTGIGLSLARELAILHKGNLYAESEIGKGTTMILRFPAMTEISANAASEFKREPVSDHQSFMTAGILTELEEKLTQSPDPGAELKVNDDTPLKENKTVLIVEDTHDMRKFIYFLLNPHFQLITAKNGREGLEKTSKHHPDLILSDVMMPEMNGYELLTAVKNDTDLKSIPIILLTAKADMAMKIEGLEMGADDYVIKPFNSKELVSRIKSQLRIRDMQNEIRIMRDQLLELNEKLEGQLQIQITELLRGGKFHSYLPPQLVHSLREGRPDEAPRSERKKMTIFFSDIVGFTETTEHMEPEELADILNEYLSEMTKIAKSFNATIDKFVGDAVLCHFGHFQSKGEKSDACDAVGMAIAMQKRMSELGSDWHNRGITDPLRIRCGINTGYVAVGDFGSQDRLDYTVIGSNVNLASRLESKAKPGGILVSHSTWGLVKEEFRLIPGEKVKVKGFDRDIPTYHVQF